MQGCDSVGEVVSLPCSTAITETFFLIQLGAGWYFRVMNEEDTDFTFFDHCWH